MKYSANSVWENKDKYDIAVVGAGHAGCEAAVAAERLGFRTVMFTVSVDSIALMPCNPNIGGSSKGHLVREVDALGGGMGKVIDRTFIQSKMLNQSKGREHFAFFRDLNERTGVECTEHNFGAVFALFA